MAENYGRLNSAGNTDLVALMQRRAELLDRDGAADSTSGSPEDNESRLREITAQLKSGLSDSEPRIRSLTLEADAHLLQRLAKGEAIHPLDDPESLEELSDRVAPDRRCFVLEHDALSGHPLNVVWVALSVGVPRSIGEVLGADRKVHDPAKCDAAVFYSIWNVERGLTGIPGGSRLLALAMDELRARFPRLETFVTLSPIPGFRAWAGTSGAVPWPVADDQLPEMAFPAGNQRDGLLHGCAQYLTALDQNGRLIDPVARFHMRNGARLWRINFAADPSTRGMERSWGLMANYRYEPEDRDENRAALALGDPAVGTEVDDLLSGIGS